MNWLDMALVCLAIVGFIKGYSDGFIRQIVTLVALIAAIYFSTEAATWVRTYIAAAEWIPPYGITQISYVVAFLLIITVVGLAGALLDKVVDISPLNLPNQIAGGASGVLAMALFLSLLFNLFEGLDRESRLISYETKVESRFYFTVKNLITTIYPAQLFAGQQEL